MKYLIVCAALWMFGAAMAQEVPPMPETGGLLPPEQTTAIDADETVQGTLGDESVGYYFVAPSHGMLVVDLNADVPVSATTASAYTDPSGAGGGGGGGGAAAENLLQVLPVRAGEEFWIALSAAQAGSYELNLQLLDETDMTPVTYGETVAGEISDARPFEVFAFNGTAGDTVSIDLEGNAGLMTSTFLVDGWGTTPVYPVSMSLPDGAARMAGDDRLVLRDDALYGVVVRPAMPEAQALEFSLSVAEIEGELDEVPQYVRLTQDEPMRVLTFLGAAGEEVTLSARLLSFVGSATITARQDDNILVEMNTADSAFGGQTAFTVPADGTVEIVVMGEAFPDFPEGMTDLEAIEAQVFVQR